MIERILWIVDPGCMIQNEVLVCEEVSMRNRGGGLGFGVLIILPYIA